MRAYVFLMRAFVLISLSGKHEHNMVDYLKSMPEVKKVYMLFGEWDIISEVETENPESLATFVIDHIRTNPHVRLTSSLLVAGR